MIDYCQSVDSHICTVVAESVPHLQLGAIRDFQNIMNSQGYWEDDCWNETKHIYTFANKSFIEFISFDKFGKAHGPRRNILFLNEANNIPYLIADQLITRTKNIVWMDWNPSEEFWFYTEMLNKRDDIDFITLTFLDNEALDDISKNEILSHKNNKEWWRVYGLGLLGVITTRIFRDWQIIDEIPHEAKLVRYGLDFGYSNDPTAITAIYYLNGGYIADEITFQKGLSNKQISDILSNQENAIIVADSAEPKSIDEIKLYGINIIPVKKGKDSVRHGIQLVQDSRMSVTKHSVNIIKDYRNYLWQVDKNGKILNEPEHQFSNSMDSIRYAMISLLDNPYNDNKEELRQIEINRMNRNQTKDYGL